MFQAPKRQQCLCSCAKQEKKAVVVRVCVCLCVCVCAGAVENWNGGTSNQIVLTGTAQFLQRSVIPVATAVHTAHLTIQGCAPTRHCLTTVPQDRGLQNSRQNSSKAQPEPGLDCES